MFSYIAVNRQQLPNGRGSFGPDVHPPQWVWSLCHAYRHWLCVCMVEPTASSGDWVYYALCMKFFSMCIIHVKIDGHTPAGHRVVWYCMYVFLPVVYMILGVRIVTYRRARHQARVGPSPPFLPARWRYAWSWVAVLPKARDDDETVEYIQSNQSHPAKGASGQKHCDHACIHM